MKLCECGCGLEVSKPKNRFVKGHTPWNKGVKGIKFTNSGQFQKGNIPWSKGISCLEATKKKISQAKKGKYLGQLNSFYGRSHSEEVKRAIGKIVRQNHKNGVYKHIYFKDDNQLGKANLGRQHTIEACKKISQGHMGEKNSSWKGGKSFEPYTSEFNDQLRELIRMRDNYTCQKCGVPQLECIRTLSIHHIDYDKTNCLPSNLITLCSICHAKANNNRDEQQNYYQEVVTQKEIASACS